MKDELLQHNNIPHNYNYEVQFHQYAYLSASGSNNATITVPFYEDKFRIWGLGVETASRTTNIFSLIINTTRIFTIVTSGTKLNTYSLNAIAYRRIGTNH